METIAPPQTSLEGLEIDAKYRIGKCIADGERQRVYETEYKRQPAVIKIFRPETSREDASLSAGFAAGKILQHPNLITVYDFGGATVLDRQVLYVVMERADENLDSVLRGRPLDEQEMRDLLSGVIPAIEYLHEKGFIHAHIRPSNVLACAETVKLSADRLRLLNEGSGVVAPPGLHDAPETGAGIFSPAADAWSLSVLILEALSGSPLESSVGQLHAPFRQIVQGGLIREPEKRWSLRQISDALRSGDGQSAGRTEPGEEDNRPLYRKRGGLAIGGVLGAAVICALLIRGAHHPPPAIQIPPPVIAAPAAQVIPAKPSPVERPGWAVVGAAYHRQADALKRAAALRKAHPGLEVQVYPEDDPNASRYLVVFGLGLTEARAKRQLDNARRSGAPGDTYITHLR